MSHGFKLFDDENAVLGFQWTSIDGNRFTNELYIDYSNFTNINIDLLKILIEK